MDFDYEKIKAELLAIRAMNEKWELRRKSLENLKIKKDAEKEESSQPDLDNEKDSGNSNK